LLTFHKIIAGCETGDSEAWRAFLRDYSPVMVQLARVYLPERCEPVSLWRDVLGAVCSEDFKLLRTFGHQSERELLIDLRSFFLDRGLANSRSDDSAQAIAEPAKQRVELLVKDLPLLHQEVVFFKLAGYSDRTLEKMFRITPAVAQKGVDRLRDGFGAWLGREQDVCLWPAEWLELVKDARAAKAEDCPSARLFLRIQDGQAGWYEKEPAERHLTQCLHCLEAWTALREVSYWRTSAPPVPPEDLEALISAIPVQEVAKRPAPFLKRIFG
jgi:hypothetical protein